MRAVIATTDTRRGGTPIRLASLAQGMRDRSWEILFVSLMPPGPVLEKLHLDGIATASLGLTSWQGFLRAAHYFRRLVREWRPDVVQTALWHANVLARCALIGTGFPIVSGYTSVDDDKPSVRILLDLATHHLASAHVAVSNAVADRLRSRERIPSQRVTVIPAGIDTDRWIRRGDKTSFRLRWGIPVDAPLVGWVGRLHPVKDLRTLIRAVGSLSGWWLVIAGDGEQASLLADWAVEAGAADRVVATGELADVHELLEGIDVFCLSSRWEGMPSAILEAMAAGLPVVATAVGGVPEVITHNVDGLLVPPGDATALAGAILEASKRSDLGRRAADTVRSRFSRAAMLDEYELLWGRVSR